MSRTDTASVVTQMVNDHALGYRPNHKFVDQAVCSVLTPTVGNFPVPFVKVPKPLPAVAKFGFSGWYRAELVNPRPEVGLRRSRVSPSRVASYRTESLRGRDHGPRIIKHSALFAGFLHSNTGRNRSYLPSSPVACGRAEALLGLEPVMRMKLGTAMFTNSSHTFYLHDRASTYYDAKSVSKDV
jgi:hypothetical protein